MILPSVTDSELVEDPTRLVAPQRYSPASVVPKFLMNSDGSLTIPPEYLLLSEMSRLCPFNNQYTAADAGESCVTLTVQLMFTVVPVSDIVPGTTTVGFSKEYTNKIIY